uniref:Nitric oxide synthase n=1 Tax=Ornithorhynchus anatinus TaxID=9258 RepID=A0A6I8PS58_ORNAN
MREGVSSPCEAAMPRMCHLIKRICRSHPTCCPATPSLGKQDDARLPGLNPSRNEPPRPPLKSPEYHAKPRLPTQGCTRHVRIKNWGNGMTFEDTLHHKAKGDLTCTVKSCQGAIMNPKTLVRGPRDRPTPREELLPQAIEFINQYYGSFKEAKIEQHLARVEAVTKEIETTATYQLKEEELIYATKQAWRNAPRCIGRIQWSNLQVFDARKCTTAKEMFEHICRHIRYSTNSGHIRSAITIFPQRSDGKHDFRIWNSQLVRYAGYLMPDGSIMGDPACVEFTQLCMDLGWEPNFGRFDVLPLILQANGQDPELFEIPPELILEVAMEHPKYEWFQELDLKWYALPAVANMLLEVGGLEFPGCPFNGWYMGTEIGVRDFCDVQRYNILEEVGRRMGLDTHKTASLWKDRAVIEVNVAVLHSFQKQNVTITDHHSAADAFMKYMQNEYSSRGGCPADWVWLVPPISGSLTPVFHQEMLNYILSPFYYYQIEAWKTHIWQDEKRRPKRRVIKFNILVKAVLFATVLMRKTLEARIKATVLYASETGKSETLARNLGDLFNCAFNTKVVCMDEYNLNNLEKEKLLLVVTSTFGNGNAPGNGEKLKKSLFTLKELNNKFRYAVFGLGSSMYPQFCAFAHEVDQKFSQLGACQLASTGEGDELSGQEEAFRSWAVDTFKVACETFDIRGKHKVHIPRSYITKENWNPQNFRIVPVSQPLDLSRALSSLHAQKVLSMKLKSRQNLRSLNSSRTTLLVQLSGERSQEVRYHPGDHLGVFPGNPPDLVQGIMGRVQDAPPTHQAIRLETCRQSGDYWTSIKKLPPCSLSQALTYFLDLTTPPTQLLLKKLAQLASKDGERQRLEALCQTSEYRPWKFSNSPTFLEVLEEFPSIEVSTAFLLTQLPLLKPRYYSISSSQVLTPKEIHLTVAVVSYRTRGGQGPLRHGVCSTWLSRLEPQDSIPCFVHSASGFQLPENPSQPCILIGPGTGIAPFRSFWQQRLFDKETKGTLTGRMTLVFGCRSHTDHLYREEAQEMKKKGVLREVYTAYSRQPGQPTVYVQDILRNSLAGEVHRVLHEDGGHVYVCGDGRMGRDVARTLKEILASKLGLSQEQAEDYFFQLKLSKYHILIGFFSHESASTLLGDLGQAI